MSVTHPLPTVISPATTQLIENTPPIHQIISFLSKFASLLVSAASYLKSAVVFLFSSVSYSTSLLANPPLKIILYILSPFIVFGQIVLGVLFVNPYHAIVDFFLAVQPFYVFCGVACISGAVIGLCGRRIAAAISVAIMGREGVGNETIEPALLGEKLRKRRGMR